MKWFFEVLKKYAVFEGRARRKEFWYSYLFFILFAYAMAWFSISIRFPLLYALYFLGLIIPFFAVGVRRMHDVNKSGWYILIPIYNIILHCTKGTEGPNDYGVDPKNPEFEEFLNDAETGNPV